MQRPDIDAIKQGRRDGICSDVCDRDIDALLAYIEELEAKIEEFIYVENHGEQP